MRTYVTWDNTTEGVVDLPTGVAHYWLRPVGGTCDEDWQAFMSLPVARRISESTTTEPASLYGWIQRSCGAVEVTDDYKIYDPGDGSGGLIPTDETATPPPTENPPGVTNNEDMAGWDNLGISSSGQNVN